MFVKKQFSRDDFTRMIQHKTYLRPNINVFHGFSVKLVFILVSVMTTFKPLFYSLDLYVCQ